MDAADPFKLQLFAHLAEEVDALIQAVKQCYVHARLHDLQNKTGKACAGSDIDDLFIRKIAHGQQRRTVEKMQTCNILKSVYRSKIHDLVALFEIFVICLQSADCLGIRRDPERGKAVIQNLFHTFSEKNELGMTQLILAYSLSFSNHIKKLWSPIFPSHVVSIIPLPQYRPTWKNSASPTVL